MVNISCSGLPLPNFMKDVIESFGEYYGDNIPWDDLRSVDFVGEFDEKMIQFQANIMADGLAQDIAEKKKMVGTLTEEEMDVVMKMREETASVAS